MEIKINDMSRYIFLRCKKEGKPEVLAKVVGEPMLVWIDYEECDECGIFITGRSMREHHAREMTDEIVISRANGYRVKIIEAPLDYETNPNAAEPKTYILESLGREKR